jgi:hypothetical protein
MTSNSSTFSKSPSAERFWQGYSHSLDEIRDDFHLDEMAGLSDDYYWNDDSDLEALYPSVSQDYLDFLLSYE